MDTPEQPSFQAFSEDELFRIALSDPDEDRAWDAIGELQRRATPGILARISLLSQSAVPNERRVAADLLGQLARTESPHRQQCTDLLVAMIEQEQEPEVIASIGVALGHWREPRGIKPLLRHLRHPDGEVRYAVALGMLTLDDPRAIAALIELSADSEDETRDWVTFGLGSMTEVDTPELRDALAARIGDSDLDVRDEALVGLAHRGDPRAFAPLINALEAGGHGSLLFEAATEFADPRLLPALLKLRDEWVDTSQWPYKPLLEAIEACSGRGDGAV